MSSSLYWLEYPVGTNIRKTSAAVLWDSRLLETAAAARNASRYEQTRRVMSYIQKARKRIREKDEGSMRKVGVAQKRVARKVRVNCTRSVR